MPILKYQQEANAYINQIKIWQHNIYRVVRAVEERNISSSAPIPLSLSLRKKKLKKPASCILYDLGNGT